MKKLAIITTHPIQYNAPFFKLLSGSGKVQPKVFYTWGKTVLDDKFDPGFNKTIEWDIPLLEGYDYEFIENTSKEKGSHHFNGIINPAIIARIDEFDPDAVLVYGWKFKSHLKVLRHYKNKKPVWFRGDSVLLNEKPGFKSFLKNKVLNWVYKHVDIAFYAGTNNRIYFEKCGLQSAQLIAAFHAVDNERFEDSPGREHAKALCEKLKIKDTDLVFMFAGKLIPTKDIGTLIKAFARIKKNRVHLVIVGSGPEEKSLKERNKGVSNLHYLDFQNQVTMPSIYQFCDIFILPSVGETWGLSVNEAMAAGKAILVSDKCGCAIDLVKDGENGYIFRAGDEEDLFEKLLLLTEAGDQLKHMQDNSSEKVQGFTFIKFADAIENVLNKTIG